MQMQSKQSKVLTLKAQIMTAADDKFCDIFPNFLKKIRYDISWADDSHEISCLICYFWKSGKIFNCRLLQIIGGTLRVNIQIFANMDMIQSHLDLRILRPAYRWGMGR